MAEVPTMPGGRRPSMHGVSANRLDLVEVDIGGTTTIRGATNGECQSLTRKKPVQKLEW